MPPDPHPRCRVAEEWGLGERQLSVLTLLPYSAGMKVPARPPRLQGCVQQVASRPAGPRKGGRPLSLTGPNPDCAAPGLPPCPLMSATQTRLIPRAPVSFQKHTVVLSSDLWTTVLVSRAVLKLGTGRGRHTGLGCEVESESRISQRKADYVDKARRIFILCSVLVRPSVVATDVLRQQIPRLPLQPSSIIRPPRRSAYTVSVRVFVFVLPKRLHSYSGLS